MGYHIMSIFNRMIEGDDALLKLAAARFSEVAMGAELHPSSAGNYELLRGYFPQSTRCTVHLPRNFNLADVSTFEFIQDFSAHGAEDLHGMVVHDSHQFAEQFPELLPQLEKLDSYIQNKLYIEYACGLGFETFYNIAASLQGLSNIGVCIDVSHLAIQACRIEFSKNHQHVDICALKPYDPSYARYIDDIDHAINNAREFTFDYLERLCKLDLNFHFHLHDGHPSSVFSKYGVCDHLSFLWRIPIPFEYKGKRSLGCFYGVGGLQKIADIISKNCECDKTNLMFEIHPQNGQSDLGAHREIFSHWEDLQNARMMNYWLDILVSHYLLMSQFVSIV